MWNRICPRCENPHKTYAKSSKAICEKCKELKKPSTKKLMEVHYEKRRKSKMV